MSDKMYPNEYRRKVFKTYDKVCQLCGDEEGAVHHVDGYKKNNSIYNLLPLCKSCHGSIHQSNGKCPLLEEYLEGTISLNFVPFDLEKEKEAHSRDGRKKKLSGGSTLVKVNVTDEGINDFIEQTQDELGCNKSEATNHLLTIGAGKWRRENMVEQ